MNDEYIQHDRGRERARSVAQTHRVSHMLQPMDAV